MRRTFRKTLLILLAAAVCNVGAQERIELQRDATVTQELQKPAPAEVARAEEVPVSVTLGRGGRVAVDNRTTGRIVVTGWDKEFVEARAVSERGVETVLYTVGGVGPEQRVWLKADYSAREGKFGQAAKPPAPGAPEPRPEPVAPAKPMPDPAAAPPKGQTVTRPNATGQDTTQSTVTKPTPPYAPGKQTGFPGLQDFDFVPDMQPREVHLEVRVPRYAEIEIIKVKRSPVEVTGVNSPIIVLGSRGDVRLRDVGAAEVRTRDGLVEIDGAAGLVDVVTSTGRIQVRNARGDVRALSISGEVDLECVRGRVNVDSTSGPVRLANISGDVDVSASNSDISFSGAIREDGRYHLKSMSGAVEMALREGPPGFTAALSTYRGTIENEFALKMKQTSQQEGDVNRRVLGSYGAGQAQITLDTFDGKVKLGRAGEMKACR